MEAPLLLESRDQKVMREIRECLGGKPFRPPALRRIQLSDIAECTDRQTVDLILTLHRPDGTPEPVMLRILKRRQL